MTRRLLAVVAVLLPSLFGALRAITTGSDYRYLIVAFASLAAVAAVFLSGSTANQTATGVAPWRRSIVALVAGTVVAAAAAFGLGASSVGAVAFVCLGFTTCFVIAAVLFGPRPRRTSDI